MRCTEQILLLAAAYGDHLGLERTTVSWRLFKDTNKLEAIGNGADLQTRRFEDAVRYLHENWPPKLAWPNNVPVPSPVGLAPSDSDVIRNEEGAFR